MIQTYPVSKIKPEEVCEEEGNKTTPGIRAQLAVVWGSTSLRRGPPAALEAWQQTSPL